MSTSLHLTPKCRLSDPSNVVLTQMPRAARSRHAQLFAVWGFVSGGTLVACSERQLPPEDPQVRIQEACEASCPVTTTCDPELSGYETVEACIAGCGMSNNWGNLEQCDWARIEFMICLGTLSCEEYDEYNTFVFTGEVFGPDWPCLVEMDWYYNCDPDQPFEQPD